ncbi:hypothetical protein GCM10007116_07480 [Sulfodiicoccus acidiphilus]|nr:hypothetical protein GCM10007116_07480 [Sulfodiicoccus acidiphilus]
MQLTLLKQASQDRPTRPTFIDGLPSDYVRLEYPTEWRYAKSRTLKELPWRLS